MSTDVMLTVEQLKELPAGAALDAEVHSIVFGTSWDESRCRVCGWKFVPDGETGCWTDNPPRADAIPPYSTEDAAAWRVVRYMATEGFAVKIVSEYVHKSMEKWNVAFDGDGYGYDEGLPLPEAVCHAALEAMCDALANADDDV